MDRKKEEFKKQFSLLCDVFKQIDPSFIDIMRRLMGKTEPKQTVERCDTEYDCGSDCCPEPEITKTDWEDCDTAQNDCCMDNEADTTSEEVHNSFYFSKVGLKCDDSCTTLNVLYVASMEDFHKYSDQWMSYAFENACMNNINDNMLYGHTIDFIHFDFFTKEDFDTIICEQENNVLCAPDWVWDPEMLTFFAKQETGEGPYKYVRMLIDTKIDNILRMKSVHVIREEDSTCEGGAIKLDYITPEQRKEFIMSMKAMRDEVAAQDSEEDYRNRKVISEKDLMESAKKYNNTDCAVSIRRDRQSCTDKTGFINMDECNKCPEKANCCPNIFDYVGSNIDKGFVIPNFLYENGEDVREMTDGAYTVVDHVDNYANKENFTYWKGCIEKDISLDSQIREWDMEDFLYFMSCAMRNAISNKCYTYQSDESGTVVCFNYGDIVEMYYHRMKMDERKNNKLNMCKFGDDTKTAPTVATLKEHMHDLSTYLCNTFDFTNVSIIKDTKCEDYFIICDY